MNTELLSKVVANIDLLRETVGALISRIEKMEKTVETYGSQIDSLKFQLDKHEKNRYKHGAV